MVSSCMIFSEVMVVSNNLAVAEWVIIKIYSLFFFIKLAEMLNYLKNECE